MSEGEIKGYYGLSRRLDLGLGVLFRQNNFTNNESSGSAAGIESFALHLKYSFKPIKKWRIALEGSFRQTAYSNDKYPAGQAPKDQIILGDEGQEATIMGHFTLLSSSSLQVSGSLGYRIPPNDLSSEILYGAEFAWTLEYWVLGVGAKGILSMGEDPFEANTANKPDQSTSPTKMFNSINREMVKPFLFVNYKFKPTWSMGLRIGSIIGGKSIDKGTEVALTFNWLTKGISSSARVVESFKEYHIEGTILKVSPRGKFVIINRGFAQDVTKGMAFDIYKSDFKGGNILLATGKIHQSQSSKAILKIIKRYAKGKIQKGMVVRGRR